MPRVAALIGLTGLVVTTAFGPAAAADPQPVYPSAGQVAGAKADVADAASQAAALDARLAALRDRVEAAQMAASDAAEEYNGAQLVADASAAASAAATAKATAARATAGDAVLALSRYAAEVYQLGGGLQQVELFVGVGGPQAVLDRVAGLDAVGDERARLMREADTANNLANVLSVEAKEAQARADADADAAQAAYDAAQASLDAASSEAATAAAEQATLMTSLAALRKTSVDLERQRQAGLAEQARRAAEEARRKAAEAKRKAAEAERRAAEVERRAADAARQAAEERRQRELADKPKPPRSSPKPTHTPRRPSPPTSRPPAPHGGVAAVIAFARAQLGEPYLWGGSGPDAWDCSGLTQGAWRRAGVQLAHYTGAQWAQTARVSITSLRPGDLVFFGLSVAGIHHVGLYIGGGQMIHAPHTGDVVKISSIYYSSDLLDYGGRP